MDKYIKILKKLSILATLSSTTTESSILSGSIFTDTRTSLYSRMLEIVNKKQFTLDLNRFIPTQDRPEFWVWVTDQLEEYATKDMYMNPSYISKTDKTLGVYWYQLEPQYDEPQYLYYNMSPSIINYILQRIPFNVRFMPGKFYIYWNAEPGILVDLIIKGVKREQKNEQQKKISIS